MIKKTLFTIFAIFIIVTVSWSIAYSENMFFHMDKEVLESEDGYYEAYVIAGQEFKQLPKPCEWNGLDVVHVSSDDMRLKDDVVYLCDSYEAMREISQDLYDSCMVTTYEVDEWSEEEGKTKKVQKRIKTKEYKEKGEPPKKLRVSIPHEYFGVEVKYNGE